MTVIPATFYIKNFGEKFDESQPIFLRKHYKPKKHTVANEQVKNIIYPGGSRETA